MEILKIDPKKGVMGGVRIWSPWYIGVGHKNFLLDMWCVVNCIVSGEIFVPGGVQVSVG
jgi:hypothetical protein